MVNKLQMKNIQNNTKEQQKTQINSMNMKKKKCCLNLSFHVFFSIFIKIYVKFLHIQFITSSAFHKEL
jgi:hypothetical protein